MRSITPCSSSSLEYCEQAARAGEQRGRCARYDMGACLHVLDDGSRGLARHGREVGDDSTQVSLRVRVHA
eukprot:3662176-Prymnesium_polylepis.2